MALIEQLGLKKDLIVKKWFTQVIDTYPAETARFLRRQSDPFANPVGQSTLQGLRTLIDLLGAGFDVKRVQTALDPIIRIRAIQDFTPARATRFVFELKRIIRDEVPENQRSSEELQRMEHLIDEMALTAFDIYMQCREKINDLKANEMKSRTYKAFARAGLIKEPDDE